MGQLVLDEVLELLVGHVHREHHAVAGGHRERSDALRDELGDDVVLLELGVGGEGDQRDRIRDLVVEPAGELVVGGLGERSDLGQGWLDAIVEGDAEVRGRVHLPVKGVVANLVLAEVLCGDRRGEQERQHGNNQTQLHRALPKAEIASAWS